MHFKYQRKLMSKQQYMRQLNTLFSDTLQTACPEILKSPSTKLPNPNNLQQNTIPPSSDSTDKETAEYQRLHSLLNTILTNLKQAYSPSSTLYLQQINLRHRALTEATHYLKKYCLTQQTQHLHEFTKTGKLNLTLAGPGPTLNDVWNLLGKVWDKKSKIHKPLPVFIFTNTSLDKSEWIQSKNVATIAQPGLAQKRGGITSMH